MAKRQRVVIVGGGYAGLRAARDLGRDAAELVEVVLVSEREEHVDVTSLYEVATAFLEHESLQSTEQVTAGAGMPLSALLVGVPVAVRTGRVERIDRSQRLVVLADGSTLGYDVLVIAVGATAATYGIAGADRYALPLKSLADAVIVRHHIVRTFREARDLPPERRQRHLTFVIVGGGITGVETAAELAVAAERHCRTLGIARRDVRIMLLEAGERLMPALPAALSVRVVTRLQELGVEVQCRQRVVAVTEAGVQLAQGRSLPTQTVVWAAGLARNPLLAGLGVRLAAGGVAVRPTLQSVDDPLVYAAGDVAVLETARARGTVPAAYTHGALVARNIRHQLAGVLLESFTAGPWPMLLALGGRRGMMVWPGGRVWTGRGPWLIKQLVALRYWRKYCSWLEAAPFWWRGFLMRLKND